MRTHCLKHICLGLNSKKKHTKVSQIIIEITCTHTQSKNIHRPRTQLYPLFFIFRSISFFCFFCHLKVHGPQGKCGKSCPHIVGILISTSRNCVCVPPHPTHHHAIFSPSLPPSPPPPLVSHPQGSGHQLVAIQLPS